VKGTFVLGLFIVLLGLGLFAACGAPTTPTPAPLGGAVTVAEQAHTAFAVGYTRWGRQQW